MSEKNHWICDTEHMLACYNNLVNQKWKEPQNDDSDDEDDNDDDKRKK